MTWELWLEFYMQLSQQSCPRLAIRSWSPVSCCWPHCPTACLAWLASYRPSPGPIYLLKWQNLPSGFACRGAWHVAYQAEMVGGTLARRQSRNRPCLAAVGCYVGSRHRVKPYPKTAAKGGTAQTGTWKGKGKAVSSTSLWLFWCDSGSTKLPPVRGEWKSSSTACRCWFKAQHKDEEAEWRPTWYL